MKRIKYNKTKVKIKSESLDKMLEACVALPSLTRASVSRYAEVSTVTAGKLLTAMDECRFTKTVYEYAENGRPQKKHLLTDSLSALVLDLSSPDYSANLVRTDGKVLLYKSYPYSSEASPKDNLSSFFSKACIDAKAVDTPISAICAILADDQIEQDFSNSKPTPTAKDKSTVNSMIAKVFGTVPTLQLTLSEALDKAAKYNKLPVDHPKDTAYVRVGRDVKLVCLRANGDPVICRAKDLLIGDGATLSDRLDSFLSPQDLAKILAKTVNLAHCAYQPRSYLIEYDTLKFGAKALGEIKRSFALLALPLPDIVARDHRAGVAVTGAAAETIRSFFKLHITTEKE